jgi:hypothetical protein
VAAARRSETLLALVPALLSYHGAAQRVVPASVAAAEGPRPDAAGAAGSGDGHAMSAAAPRRRDTGELREGGDTGDDGDGGIASFLGFLRTKAVEMRVRRAGKSARVSVT